jgi:hypothetical protein
LNDFYKKTKFHNFFIKNENIRKIAEENFAKEVIDNIDFDWFKRFFKTLPEKKFQIIVHLNGWNCYGPKVIYKDGTEEFYAIISSYKVDENGFPTFDNRFGNTLIHEISHSFFDSYIAEYIDELLPQATVFYQLNSDELRQLYCGRPYSYLGEILVRAAVFQYAKDHNYYDEYELKAEVNNGFLWLPQLLEAFGKYEMDTTYKTFNDFMPEIVKLQNSLNPQQLYDEIASITGSNISNNNDSVDYNLDHISLYFDKPIYIMSNRMSHYLDISPKIEFTKAEKWNDNATELTLYVKLEPDTQYRINIVYVHFLDAKNEFYLKNGYILTFKTIKK